MKLEEAEAKAGALEEEHGRIAAALDDATSTRATALLLTIALNRNIEIIEKEDAEVRLKLPISFPIPYSLALRASRN